MGESVLLGLGPLPDRVEEGLTSTVTVSIRDDDIPGPDWSANLAVGTDNRIMPDVAGYSKWGTDIDGTLSNSTFTANDQTVEIQILVHMSGGLYLGLNRNIDYDFVLTIGDDEFVASQSLIPFTAAQAEYWWGNPDIDWSSGDTVEVSITLSDEELGEREKAPPAAYFQDVPGEHDGTEKFMFRLYFTEQFPISFKTLRDHAMEATGGRRQEGEAGVQRQQQHLVDHRATILNERCRDHTGCGRELRGSSRHMHQGRQASPQRTNGDRARSCHVRVDPLTHDLEPPR